MKQFVIGVPVDVLAGSVPVQLPKERVVGVTVADGVSPPVVETGKRDKKRRRQDEHAADMDPAELLEQRAQFRLQSRRGPLYALHHLRTYGADGLVIVVDSHPLAVLLQTIRLLKPGSPFAVFYHNLHELCECFQQLRHYGLASRMLLLEAWTRKYQVCVLESVLESVLDIRLRVSALVFSACSLWHECINVCARVLIRW